MQLNLFVIQHKHVTPKWFRTPKKFTSIERAYEWAAKAFCSGCIVRFFDDAGHVGDSIRIEGRRYEVVAL